MSTSVAISAGMRPSRSPSRRRVPRSNGVLLIANLPGGFAPRDLEAASALAPRIAVAVELARIGESRRRAREQESELLQHREPQRIADDLHDHVSQLLFPAQLALDEARQAGPQAGAVRTASEFVRRAETALRDAIFLVVEPTDAGAVRLRVTDDGTGTRTDLGAGHGLAALHRRAAELGGALTLVSSAGGTDVVLMLPLSR